jgi:hypothetical protein
LPRILAAPVKSLTTRQGGEVRTAGHGFQTLNLG